MKARKLRSGVSWKEMLKQKDVKQGLEGTSTVPPTFSSLSPDLGLK